MSKRGFCREYADCHPGNVESRSSSRDFYGLGTSCATANKNSHIRKVMKREFLVASSQKPRRKVMNKVVVVRNGNIGADCK